MRSGIFRLVLHFSWKGVSWQNRSSGGEINVDQPTTLCSLYTAITFTHTNWRQFWTWSWCNNLQVPIHIFFAIPLSRVLLVLFSVCLIIIGRICFYHWSGLTVSRGVKRMWMVQVVPTTPFSPFAKPAFTLSRSFVHQLVWCLPEKWHTFGIQIH